MHNNLHFFDSARTELVSYNLKLRIYNSTGSILEEAQLSVGWKNMKLGQPLKQLSVTAVEHQQL